MKSMIASVRSKFKGLDWNIFLVIELRKRKEELGVNKAWTS